MIIGLSITVYAVAALMVSFLLHAITPVFSPVDRFIDLVGVVVWPLTVVLLVLVLVYGVFPRWVLNHTKQAPNGQQAD
tara:strand:- start:1350 stop:1583 length:234 start_codon:yes stop_codon:yes gene_type:complete